MTAISEQTMTDLQSGAALATIRHAAHDLVRAAGGIVDDDEQSLAQTPGMPLVSVQDAVNSRIQFWGMVFKNADLAYRKDRALQREMRNDPDVESALAQRILATALEDWELTPEDPDDPIQRAEAAALTEAIKKLPNLTELIRNLLLAVWFGHAAVNILYREATDDDAIVGEDTKSGTTVTACYYPGGWQPIHPDSLTFAFDGTPALKVYAGSQTAQRLKKGERAYGESGIAMILTPEQRKSLVLSVVSIEGAEFDTPEEAALPYSGVGLRTRLWYTWFLKQAVAQAEILYCEKLGRPYLIGRYPDGNTAARDAMIDALNNLVVDGFAVAPAPGEGTPKEGYMVDVLEASGTGHQVLSSTRASYQDKVRTMIVGQTLTMGTASTGLGSGVSDAHESTFARIVKYDARCLDDALSRDLVAVLHRMNFPTSKRPPRWKTLVDEQDPKEVMESVKVYIDMGGTVPDKWVRGILGVPEPEPGDIILGGVARTPTDMGGAPGDDLSPETMAKLDSLRDYGSRSSVDPETAAGLRSAAAEAQDAARGGFSPPREMTINRDEFMKS